MILCFSGGIDSLVAYYYLGKPPCVYFNCNSYSSAELEAVLSLNPDCIINSTIDLSSTQQGKNAYIPHRNMIFAALASQYDSVVVMAGVKDDEVEDKNPSAFHAIGMTLTATSKSPVSVISPFWEMTKPQVIGWFLENVPKAVSLMQLSVSCYNNEKFCGACPSCFRKGSALWANKLSLEFKDQNLLADYYRKAISGAYNPSRCEEIIKYYNANLGWKGIGNENLR